MSKPLHNDYCKEIGTRILLHFIARIANINRLGVIPLLTFYSQHFIRVFCLTSRKTAKITNSFNNYGYIIHCNKCGFRRSAKCNIIDVHLECPYCRSHNELQYAGPLWIGEIHQKEFIHLILELNQLLNLPNKKRLSKLLQYIQEEIDMPLSYYNIHKLSKELKIKIIPTLDKIIESIRNLGYRASRTHFDFTSIKTNLNNLDLKKLFLNNHFN
jgi:tRNA (guanine26-N2/guanine27-N2)-dimethyltransferase